VIRAVREGFPAQAAVQSALLARDGVTGFEQPLEGRAGFYALYAGSEYEPADLLDAHGTQFWIEHLTFKRWPSCRGTHPFIELALNLRSAPGFDLQCIERIDIRIDEVQRMLTEPAARKAGPQTLIDAKFSIPFCLALALVCGTVDLDSFGPEALGDPAVLALAARVSTTVNAGEGWQPGSGGAMVIRLRDGTALEAQTADSLGCPARPLTTEDLVAKFVDCAGRAALPLSDAAANALASRILALETCENVGALFV
jgi:2-methylcitrate dehydratase PrpD